MNDILLTPIRLNELEVLIHNSVVRAMRTQATQPKEPAEEETKELLSIDEAADLLGLSKPTIYSKCSRGELPYMKRSKRLYFSRTELIEYIKAGRVKTNEERQDEVRNHLLKVKKGLNHEK